MGSGKWETVQEEGRRGVGREKGEDKRGKGGGVGRGNNEKM